MCKPVDIWNQIYEILDLHINAYIYQFLEPWFELVDCCKRHYYFHPVKFRYCKTLAVLIVQASTTTTSPKSTCCTFVRLQSQWLVGPFGLKKYLLVQDTNVAFLEINQRVSLPYKWSWMVDWWARLSLSVMTMSVFFISQALVSQNSLPQVRDVPWWLWIFLMLLPPRMSLVICHSLTRRLPERVVKLHSSKISMNPEVD